MQHRCQHCQRLVFLPDDLAATVFACPACQSRIELPHVDAAGFASHWQPVSPPSPDGGRTYEVEPAEVRGWWGDWS